ncbi:PIH1 domain-containing protein 2 [Octopus bimaculoides]|uniref:PIH1D1/2/3 CS-like domain-containing protein n=1 Tax=Octopus bimaculoides TaxID=37653 RepID=A0A0L8HQ23_OCTBM|nr:PIH1 domain-containing protein 2 [Octopus bimaculoides]|eukprot:XP_014770440.1 PREDICTED: PIH1 domain-containing protein 2-like [Octopus bimaculoides]
MVSILPNTQNSEQDKVLQQAEQIWSMLDDMVVSDPTAYKKFIENQMKDAHKFLEKNGTKPEFGLKVKLKDDNDYLFLEIYSSLLVPAPNFGENIAEIPSFIQTEEDSEHSNKHNKPHILVALNPLLTSKLAPNGSLLKEQQNLVEYLLENIQAQIPFSLVTSDFSFFDKKECKGDIKRFLQFLNEQVCKRKQNKVPDVNGNAINNKLDSIKLPQQSEKLETLPLLNLSKERPQKERKPKLIEELPVKEPRYTLDNSNADSLCVAVELPGVKSGDECEVDIIQDVLMVTVMGKYDLFLPLDAHVDDSRADAQFHKDKAVLSVRLPYLETL